MKACLKLLKNMRMRRANQMKHVRRFLVVCLIIFFGFVFNVGMSKVNKPEAYKIGAILPMTGTASEIAEQHKKGMDFAVAKINNSGGINGKRIEIIYEDDRNDPKTTVAAFNKLIGTHQVPVVITVMSGPSMAVYPVAEKNNVVLFANCGHPEIANLSPWVFRNFPSSAQEAEKMIEFLRKEVRLNSLFIFYINDAYGDGAKNVIVKKFTEAKGEILGIDAYDKGGLDFRSIIHKMIQKKPEGVYVFGYGKATGLITKQIKEMGYRGLLIGSYNFSVAPINVIASEALEESIFTSPIFTPESTGEDVSNFVSSFESNYGAMPPWNAVIEYDAIHLISSVIEEYGYEGEAIKKGLIKKEGFNGIAGNYKKKGDEWLAEITIKKYKKGKIVVYEK